MLREHWRFFLSLFILEVDIVTGVKPQQTYNQTAWQTHTCRLQFFGHICDDGFGTHLEDQLAFDESGHWVRGANGILNHSFHRALRGTLRVPVAGMLGEHSEGFLQFDLFSKQNVMPYDQHWHPLMDGTEEEIWTKKKNNNFCYITRESWDSPNLL